MKNRSKVVYKMIKDKDYDIPVWLYDYIDEDVLLELMEEHKESIDMRIMVQRYTYDVTIRQFFDVLRGSLKLSREFVEDMIRRELYGFALLLFGEREYRIVRRYCKRKEVYDTNGPFLRIVINYATLDEMFIERGKLAVKYSNEPKTNFIFFMRFSIEKGSMEAYNLIRILEASKDIQLCELCLSYSIPVLYESCDYVDLYQFLECVLENDWKHDFDIPKGAITKEDTELIDRLIKISYSLNTNILRHLKGLMPPEIYTKTCYDAISRKRVFRTNIVDFDRMIEIFGENKYGYSIPLQKEFIEWGGSVISMIGENGLKPEATILKTMDEANFVINHLNMDEIRFLIYNCPEFVRIISTSNTLNQNNMLRVMRALCEYPLNEELWRVLNPVKTKEQTRDFRYYLIYHITGYFNIENLYDYVPSFMMYRIPSVFYVTRRLDSSNIKYIPVDRLVPYIRDIISREPYVPFNLFCEGERVSLSKVIGSNEKVLLDIIQSEKYGYLCDITEIEPDELFAIIDRYDQE